MTPRGKSALLWGAIGGLAFLVLAQGAVLAGQRLPINFLGRVGVAVGVAALAAGGAYLLEPRLDSP